MVSCSKCGSTAFYQEASFNVKAIYEVWIEYGEITRSDVRDLDEYDQIQDNPFVCKKCQTPLLDENGIPLIKASDIAAWEVGMAAVDGSGSE